jgi:hypothetical protein
MVANHRLIVLLDLIKAFDSVENKILLDSFFTFGFMVSYIMLLSQDTGSIGNLLLR